MSVIFVHASLFFTVASSALAKQTDGTCVMGCSELSTAEEDFTSFLNTRIFALADPPVPHTLEAQEGQGFPWALGDRHFVAAGQRVQQVFGFKIHGFDLGVYLDKDSNLWGKNVTREEFFKEAPGDVTLVYISTLDQNKAAMGMGKKGQAEEKSTIGLKDLLRKRMAEDEPGADEMAMGYAKLLMGGSKDSAHLNKVDMAIVFKEGIHVATNQKYKGWVKGGAVGHALLKLFLDKGAVIPELWDSVHGSLSKPKAKSLRSEGSGPSITLSAGGDGKGALAMFKLLRVIIPIFVIMTVVGLCWCCFCRSKKDAPV